MTCRRDLKLIAALNKANNILGIVYRTLGPTNQEALSILHITSVRLILEYAAPAV